MYNGSEHAAPIAQHAAPLIDTRAPWQPCAQIVPVVLAGGAGTRLWPLSRESFPKQLIDVIGAQSLLQATVARLAGFAARWRVSDAPIVVCGEEHRFIMAEQLRASGVAARLLIEPQRRDTAPALTLAAALAVREGGDAILAVMPADHAIGDLAALHQALDVAAGHAEAGAIVALGVPPTRPDSGFGYIKLGVPLELGAHRIARFVEKPPAELAAQYVASASYWWNSGIFVVRASVWLATLQRLQPAMHASCVAALAQAQLDGAQIRPDPALFAAAPSNSIDYAVMERLGGTEPLLPGGAAPLPPGVVVPLEAGWSDLGSWSAVWAALDKDAAGNAGRGRVIFEGATSSYAHSQGRLVACLGTHDIVVVETDDAVLVAERTRLHEIKALVARIKAEQGSEADTHRKVQRPWGYYDSVDHGERFQVKRLVVQPGARLSLQLHHHRAEHWVVVRGTARVTRGDEQFLLSENESTYIPLGVRHRLENPGRVPVEIIEIQSGAYLGEDDIVRFDDNYGRCGQP
jgi:mannose-1-phosphate guanylyltransferase/mannose-6-phosphate isomerase